MKSTKTKPVTYHYSGFAGHGPTWDAKFSRVGQMIVVEVIDGEGRDPEYFAETFVRKMEERLSPYSNLPKKKLKAELQKEIERLEKRINEYKMATLLCEYRMVVFKGK